MTANTYDKGTDLPKTCLVEKLKKYTYTTPIRSATYDVTASNLFYAFYSNCINITAHKKHKLFPYFKSKSLIATCITFKS